ncbi:hypothetical protein A2U01_0067679 [Trifolium medium]|uniref:Uncharacterized protein n=1 Tax=Trifolium medium TaxID=97028 RepID=A0A392SCQ5_9FABA|nr:hypothetical protein [Trifolium medium]
MPFANQLSLLAAEFAMKDLGPLSYFLGIAVSRHILVASFLVIALMPQRSSTVLAWRLANHQPFLLTLSRNSAPPPAHLMRILPYIEV